MKILFVLALFLLYAKTQIISGAPSSKMGAIIISGNESHYMGELYEQDLTRKNYDVFRFEIDFEVGKYGAAEVSTNWNRYDFLRYIPNDYDQLIIAVTGHGDDDRIANLKQNSIYSLIKYLEEKGKEIFLYIDACHSGDHVEGLRTILNSEKLKIFLVTSCKNLKVAWNVQEQFLSRYWYWNYYSVNRNQPISLIKENSTMKDVAEAFSDHKCEVRVGCTKIHAHIGENELASKWKLLPLTIKTGEYNDNTELHKFNFLIPENYKIGTDTSFDVNFETPMNFLDDDVAAIRTIAKQSHFSNWKIKIGDNQNFPNLDNKLSNAQYILKVNNLGLPRDLKSNENPDKYIAALKSVQTMKVGSYKNNVLNFIPDNVFRINCACSGKLDDQGLESDNCKSKNEKGEPWCYVNPGICKITQPHDENMVKSFEACLGISDFGPNPSNPDDDDPNPNPNPNLNSNPQSNSNLIWIIVLSVCVGVAALFTIFYFWRWTKKRSNPETNFFYFFFLILAKFFQNPETRRLAYIQIPFSIQFKRNRLKMF